MTLEELSVKIQEESLDKMFQESQDKFPKAYRRQIMKQSRGIPGSDPVKFLPGLRVIFGRISGGFFREIHREIP